MIKPHIRTSSFPAIIGRVVGLSLFPFLLASCLTGSGTFKLKGKFKNLNQGEFYVYSPDGVLKQVDTIRVDRGSFVYTVACDEPATLMLVFPNFSEQPVFAQPGKTVQMQGDATNLREMQVKGTDDNELMTAFRQQAGTAPTAQARKAAEQFAHDHPQSQVAPYLVRRYFMQGDDPDYRRAVTLLTPLAAAQPKNIPLARLLQKAKELSHTDTGQPLPPFSDTDIQGHSVSNAAFSSAPVTVVTTWSTWNFDSQNTLRQLRRTRRKAPGRLRLLSIFLDGNTAEMHRLVERDTIDWPVIADPNLFEGKTVRAFGLSFVGDNLVYRNGRLVASHLSNSNLISEVEKQMAH